MITEELVLTAFNSLKNYAYYENLNFFLKAEVALFENKELDNSIQLITDYLLKPKEDTFQEWLEGIRVEILPKKITSPLDVKQNDKSLFLNNKKTANQYTIDSVNYLISAPIEIYIIETLWSIIVGSMLDEGMTDSSYGNRVSESIIELRKNLNFDRVNTAKNIFSIYIENYNKWRDQAINKAIQEVEENDKDVAILSLDLKGFYYNIKIDFAKISDFIDTNQVDELLELSHFLNDRLKEIHEKYNSTIHNDLFITHPHLKHGGIPIGFTSSAILANWYMIDFDEDILKQLKPSYYGRYVDDILFVFTSPEIGEDNYGNEVSHFIKETLSSFIEKNNQDNNELNLTEKYHSLPIQKDKLIFHFFNKEHSLAGLKVFKQEVENRSSAFRFLPDEHITSELDRFAYDIMYDGSANKFRSIVGMAENETELSKYLSSHIIAHRLCKTPSDENTLEQISLFFKGENALRFSRLWEKVLSYTLITKKYEFTVSFYNYIKRIISKVKWKDGNENLTFKIQDALYNYIDISLSLNLALLDQRLVFKKKKIKDTNLSCIANIAEENQFIGNLVKQFRYSNLIRHNLVSWPLANYTNYNGDLTDEVAFLKIGKLKLSKRKKKTSPRYINNDEYQLFHLIDAINSNTLSFFTEQNSYHSNNCEVRPFKNKSAIKIKVKSSEKNKKIKIALANIKVDRSSIEDACREDRNPNLSYERQKNLYKVLNSANEEEADILLLPELSIPVSWLPFMAAHSRRKQIALIFGLEHWVINGIAYNIIVECLPYTPENKYKSSLLVFRIKNHYAPSEIDILNSFRLGIGSPLEENHKYHLIKWKGITFATYNCFELANIKHRALFRSQIDILFACVWNKDTKYYQHITESAARDLHCYVAQANTSHYGGSCVLQPTKSDISNKIYVKGGENNCILTTTLDITSLREAQYRSSRVINDIIKPNPPGFNHGKLLKRSKDE
ncbi:reverse transcriptase domain-containing protein [Pantoea anthophila]|uniref:reverse transcriptase domain-containing protein n=1 Tax=Pantoea anthophila TaxID=470931 RepID=UPI00301A5188